MITSTRPKVFKALERQREGKGFSRNELKRAGSNIQEALRFRISVDPKRKTAHEHNINELKTLLNNKRATWKPKPKPQSKKPEIRKETKQTKPVNAARAKAKPKAKSKK